MEKLIITVAVDCVVSFPNNPFKIPGEQVDRVVEEYVRGVEAGAAITHIHGVRRLESQIQADGRKVSRLDVDGWRRMQEGILSRCDAVMQFGIAAARLEERKKVMALGPDMMSVIFGPHDECFQPDPSIPANEIYATHTRDELLEYMDVLEKFEIRPEIECFSTGAYWNIDFVRRRRQAPSPLLCTLFFGWPGGTWTPATPRALSFMLDYLPPDCVWNISVQDVNAHWGLMAQAILQGGHVRVGWEDNPYVEPGVFARNNAMLVQKVKELAHSLGREVATAGEARRILALPAAKTVA